MDYITPYDVAAIVLSLKVAVTSTLVTLPAGFCIAYVLAMKQFKGKVVIEGVINLPLVLPPVVTGYLLLLLLGQNGLVGQVLSAFDIHIIFTLKGAVIASSVVGFPLLVRAIRIGLESIDRQYLKVSRTLGASWWDTLFTVTIPLCSHSIITGMTLMFARSLGEFGATIILAGNMPGVTQTIPLAIFQYTTTPGGDRLALSLCLVSIILSFVVVTLGEVVNSRLSRRTR